MFNLRKSTGKSSFFNIILATRELQKCLIIPVKWKIVCLDAQVGFVNEYSRSYYRSPSEMPHAVKVSF